MKIKTMLVTYKKTVVSLIILTIIISILPVAIRYIGIHYPQSLQLNC